MSKKDEINDLKRRLDISHEAYDSVELALKKVRETLEIEYGKHKPLPFGDRLSLGNRPSGVAIFQCDACNGEVWPCKTWHLLHTLYSATYGIPRQFPNQIVAMQDEPRPDLNPNNITMNFKKEF